MNRLTATTAELDLEGLEISLVLDDLDEGLQKKKLQRVGVSLWKQQ
jgi:hypothetical protein